VDRLEDVLRTGESSDDLVLLRGGEDTSAKLLRQAALLEARYTYPQAFDPRSCSALTPGCDLPRRQRYAPRTSTSSTESSPRPSSGRTSH
jgi:hypothetical protein